MLVDSVEPMQAPEQIVRVATAFVRLEIVYRVDGILTHAFQPFPALMLVMLRAVANRKRGDACGYISCFALITSCHAK